MTEHFTPDEKSHLLTLARKTLVAVTAGKPRLRPDLAALPPHLSEVRACFVTLRNTRHENDLRGCTGTVIARRPLAEEVSLSTEQTALHDPRFQPVTSDELPDLSIEISVLTPPQPLPYDSPDDLLRLLRPGVDGVLLQHGYHRATFLPQVWENVRDTPHFLSMLSRKMGLAADAWRTLPMTVHIYQSNSFEEDPLARHREAS